MVEKKAALEVHLQPSAKRNEIIGLRDGVLWVRVTAPPLKGQANKALLDIMAQALTVPKDDLSLIRGHASRHKVVAIHGLNPTELNERLAKVLPTRSYSKKIR